MFISIFLDLASTDSKNAVKNVIREYGITKIQDNLFESYEFPTKKLGNLKRDLTGCLDMYDKLRLYQYPMDNVLKISYIENGKWKKLIRYPLLALSMYFLRFLVGLVFMTQKVKR